MAGTVIPSLKSIDEWKFSHKMQEIKIDSLEKDKKELTKQVKLLMKKYEGYYYKKDGTVVKTKINYDEHEKILREIEEKHLNNAKEILDQINRLFTSSS